jgi:hypothetical protein
VKLSNHLAVQPALPLAQVNLAQVGLDQRHEAEPLSQRRGGLPGAAQRGDVDRVDSRFGEPVTQLASLRVPEGR